MIPQIGYAQIVWKQEVLREWAESDLGDGYKLRYRLLAFWLKDREGQVYHLGPCLSMQIFSPQGKFLKALFLPTPTLGDIALTLKEIGEQIRR